MSKTDQSLVKVVNFRFDMNSIEDSIGEVKTSKFSICHPRATQPFDEITTIWNIVVTIETNSDPEVESITLERSVKVCLIPLTDIPFDFSYHVTILDCSDNEMFVSEFFEFKGSSVKVGEVLNGGINVENLKEEYLNLRFVIIKKDSAYTQLSESKLQPINESLSFLLDDFKKLYNDMDYADINLIACGVPIPAHKLILCARSSEFKKKIDGKMDSSLNYSSANDSSSLSGFIAIDFSDDYNPAVSKKIFDFDFCIYNEVEFDNFTKGYYSVELYKLAVEFKVKGLAELSLTFITESVHGFVGDDIVEVMEMANERGYEDLFYRSVMIFFANYIKNSKCDAWNDINVVLKIKIFDLIARMNFKNLQIDVVKV